MNIQKTINILSLLFLFSLTSNAQNSKYVGTWTLVKSPIKDKCAKKQDIILREDGTATYVFGKDGGGCKKKVQEFKTWKVETKEFKRRKKSIKKTVLVIGENKSIIFYIEKKKRNSLTVTTDLTSGDTTKDALITFKKS
ncbi:MAG: hypothetical protein AB8F74_19515 [Saprospiraceae bacterium]